MSSNEDRRENDTSEKTIARKRYKKALEPGFDMRELPLSTRSKWMKRLKDGRKSIENSNLNLLSSYYSSNLIYFKTFLN